MPLTRLPGTARDAWEKFVRIIADRIGEQIDQHEGLDISFDEHEEFYGSTFEIVYGPASELVRSFALTDFGDNDGRIVVCNGDN